jgi:replicative DNA helicase
LISLVILQNLISSADYWRKVKPYLIPDYFDEPGEKLIYQCISDYIERYGNPPPVDALRIEMDELSGLDENLVKNTQNIIDNLAHPEKVEQDWLVDKTEEFCQERAITLALRKAIQVLDGGDKVLDKGAIPDLLRDALAVSFDVSIGHDFLEDWEQRFEAYRTTETHIPFDIDYLNKITQGGVYRKTITILMAGSGVGKSICLCHMAAANLAAGLNVLYISCELSELRLAERIEMNLMDISDHDLSKLSREAYERKVQIMKSRYKGKLIFKEYPNSTAGTAHFRHLLAELKTMKNFVPDVIYIDYLNIMVSSKMKMTSNMNSYTWVKSITEEVRALAVDLNVPIFTATQVNRAGYDNGDLDATNTSESMGLVHTADLFLALHANDDMKRDKQIMVKQLKNRYRDENKDNKFLIGMDKDRMRLFNLEDSAQALLIPAPVQGKSGAASVKDKKVSFTDFS